MIINGQNVPLFHGRTATINTTATTLPTTTQGSGKGETNDYSGKYAYTIKGEGLTYIGDVFTGFDLQYAQINFNKIYWTLTDDTNIQWYGIALVTSTSFDANFDALNTFSNDLLGDGEYTFIKTDTPPILPPGLVVTILDQFGNFITSVEAPGTYVVTVFDTIDLHSFNPATDQPIVPQIIITQSV